MRKITIAGKEVEIYDGIEELPIVRFHKYNKMLLIDAGIGSDMADLDGHIDKAMRYMAMGKNDLAQTELENMRQNIYFINAGISPKNYAFAALVKSIDGKECTDMSDDGLKAIVEMLSDATQKEMTAELDAVKKKIDDEMRLYFPALFDDAEVKEYYDKLKERTLAVLQAIITGESQEKKIEKLTTELITYFRPSSFTGSKSIEISYDKQFDRMCIMLAQQLNVNPKKYSVMEYYNAFEYLKEKAKREKNQKTQKRAI